METASPQTIQQAAPGQSRSSVKSLAGGVGGAILASACCLPGAVALAIGASMGTAASLYRLQSYQLLFQAGGLALALGWSWWLVRRSRKTCSVSDHQRIQNRVPLLVVGSFGAAFLFINLLLIPWLERI